AGYHLELALPDRHAARAVEGTLRAMGVQPHQRRRRGDQVVYLKGSEEIAAVLAAMGASQAVLHLENVRILREARGQANRVANSETANLRRVVATGMHQAAVARGLMAAGLLADQPAAIREVATARLAMTA